MVKLLREELSFVVNFFFRFVFFFFFFETKLIGVRQSCACRVKGVEALYKRIVPFLGRGRRRNASKRFANVCGQLVAFFGM